MRLSMAGPPMGASPMPCISSANIFARRGIGLKISLEPKPNEPRGDIYVSTVGTAMGIISMLPTEDQPLVK